MNPKWGASGTEKERPDAGASVGSDQQDSVRIWEKGEEVQGSALGDQNILLAELGTLKKLGPLVFIF